MLTTQPNLGQVYETVGERTIRRVLLQKSEQHVYASRPRPEVVASKRPRSMGYR